MSSPKTPQTPATKSAKRALRTDILAVAAIVSVLALIDSEIVACGVPGVVTATDMFHLPMVIGYAVIGILLLLTLWLSVSLGRHIWRVEHELSRTPESG
jgi:hypothetical protein